MNIAEETGPRKQTRSGEQCRSEEQHRSGKRPDPVGPSSPVGQVRPVVVAPAQVLSRPTVPLEATSAEAVALCADLVATMAVSPGCVGLAAPQVGVNADAFCVDVSGHPKTRTTHGLIVLVNARILEASRNERAREGCMSVPDLTGDVKRATKLRVRGQLPGSGEMVEISTDAFEARALQHEIDHCAGQLFVDRVAGAHALHPRKVYLPRPADRLGSVVNEAGAEDG